MASASGLLVSRGVRKLIRQPMALVMGLATSLFFLVVYNAGIGGIGNLPEFGNAGYLAFLFPLSIVSLAMGSASGAGEALHADMQSGYFKRLYLSPAPGWAFVAAPLVADGLGTLVISAALLGVGALFGVPFRFGWLSVVGVLGLSMLWGTLLSALSAGVMLRTGSHQGARAVTTAVFPLIFLSTTFLPRALVTSGWLLTVSWGNPVTYLLGGMRFLLGGTEPAHYLWIGYAFTALGALAAMLFAMSSSRKVLV